MEGGKVAVVLSKGENGIKCGSTRADPLTNGVRHGEGYSRGGNAANALSAVKLPIIELGLFGAGGSEDNGVPGWNPTGMAYRKPEMVPSFPQSTFQVGFGLPPLPGLHSIQSDPLYNPPNTICTCTLGSVYWVV